MCPRKRSRPKEGASGAGESSEASASGEDSEDERGQDRQGRGRVDTMDSGDSSSSGDASESGREHPGHDGGEASASTAAPEVQISKPLVAMRAATMFVVGSDWPVEVRKPLMAPKVTNEVVKLTIEVCKDLCERDGKALSRAFGNFDQRVAIGWLLADMAGRLLLSVSRPGGARAQNQSAARRSGRKDRSGCGSAEGSCGRA